MEKGLGVLISVLESSSVPISNSGLAVLMILAFCHWSSMGCSMIEKCRVSGIERSDT